MTSPASASPVGHKFSSFPGKRRPRPGKGGPLQGPRATLVTPAPARPPPLPRAGPALAPPRHPASPPPRNPQAQDQGAEPGFPSATPLRNLSRGSPRPKCPRQAPNACWHSRGPVRGLGRPDPHPLTMFPYAGHAPSSPTPSAEQSTGWCWGSVHEAVTHWENTHYTLLVGYLPRMHHLGATAS